MKAQLEKSSSYNNSSIFKWFGLGTLLGIVASVLLSNVAVGIFIGLSLSFWVAIICKRCISEAL